jgi:hypothetical protein
MSQYISVTRTYLIVLTVFVVVRFVLEASGVADNITSEISVTRLLLVLPVFLGLRFARGELGGFKDLLLANFTYVAWAQLLILVAGLLDRALGLGTHYGFAAPGSMVVSRLGTIVLATILTSLICFVTSKIVRQ